MLVKTKTILKIATKSKITKNLNFGNFGEVKTKTSLKELFKYFTVNMPEILIGKADLKAIEQSKKEIKEGDFLSLNDLLLKMKSN